MVWVYRFMVVPDANKATAREVAIRIANTQGPGSADGLWTTGLNALGTGTPTHWVSAGMIQANFAALLGDAASTFAAYQASGGTTATLLQIQALYAAATIRGDVQGAESAAIAALGLKQIASAP